MGVDLTSVMADLASVMGKIESTVDSDLRDFGKTANKEDAEKMNILASEAANAVKKSHEQMTKVHYESKRRQEKQRG